jgi:hypothetical protein
MMLAFPPVAHPFRRVARLTAVLLAAAFARAAERPLNILHLHADDHRADAVRALGNPVVQTPHLDALVARGMTFTRAYTMGAMTPAVCLPSRTMMLTGRSLFRIGPPAKDVRLRNLADGQIRQRILRRRPRLRHQH